jgi:mono/diheme cytochrome c family protein
MNDITPKYRILRQGFSLFIAALAGCDNSGNSDALKTTARWYTQSQVEDGRELFQRHCAVCHGENAEGTLNWLELDANGNYPPPPLDGTAHAWHHPLPVLERVIAEGGVAFGGVMPGFAALLGEDQIRSVVAYFQSQWSEDIYEQWTDINGR